MKKKPFPVKVSFMMTNGWGCVHILPSLELCVEYSRPTIIFNWWTFRMDIAIRRRFPDWFMNTVWKWITLDFGKRNK